MKFGENLKLIRKSKKISQEELAEKLGVSKMQISKWETGEGSAPNLSRLIQLANVYDISIDKLVGRS